MKRIREVAHYLSLQMWRMPAAILAGGEEKSFQLIGPILINDADQQCMINNADQRGGQ